MKVLALAIEMISYTDNKGNIKPVRFRMQIDDEPMQVIKIDKVIVKDTQRFAGNIMTVYKCQSLIDNSIKLFEIKYELATCRWILYKI
ncbi:hypothetical protein LL033_00145 [Clostridium estertheticum]|uniref:hypothetical protein n=1 Tax=Clostridium estertheticum TaxID=238834 RepID=UPI001C0C18BD|nr:hypothetical protein [Clostridium estertheticum]MBU3215027.1 hypothetical protein [Clostridium estertheticum]WAG55682.1 hypothetical protein LL033_00145 [Clostridium estertheticum]